MQLLGQPFGRLGVPAKHQHSHSPMIWHNSASRRCASRRAHRRVLTRGAWILPTASHNTGVARRAGLATTINDRENGSLTTTEWRQSVPPTHHAGYTALPHASIRHQPQVSGDHSYPATRFTPRPNSTTSSERIWTGPRCSVASSKGPDHATARPSKTKSYALLTKSVTCSTSNQRAGTPMKCICRAATPRSPKMCSGR